MVVETELENTHDEMIPFLTEIYVRMQGARVDPELGYHGAMARSIQMGDIIVVDGEPYVCARFRFDPIELDVDWDDVVGQTILRS